MAEWSPTTLNFADAHVQQPDEPAELAKVSFGRKVATGANITKHFAKSHTTGLLLRPFSSLRNLVSLTVGATTGFIKDVTLDTVLLPRLERRGIPPVAMTVGMDLVAWENDLDRISGTRRTRG